MSVSPLGSSSASHHWPQHRERNIIILERGKWEVGPFLKLKFPRLSGQSKGQSRMWFQLTHTSYFRPPWSALSNTSGSSVCNTSSSLTVWWYWRLTNLCQTRLYPSKSPTLVQDCCALVMPASLNNFFFSGNGRFPDNHFPGQTFPGQDLSVYLHIVRLAYRAGIYTHYVHENP